MNKNDAELVGAYFSCLGGFFGVLAGLALKSFPLSLLGLSVIFIGVILSMLAINEEPKK